MTLFLVYQYMHIFSVSLPLRALLLEFPVIFCFILRWVSWLDGFYDRLAHQVILPRQTCTRVCEKL